MRITPLHLFIALVFLALSAAHAELPPFRYSTNTAAIANGHVIILALRSGDSRKVQELAGSEVVFSGVAPFIGGGTNITVESNIVLNVELRPWHSVRTPGAVSEVEVSGTLKRVDFDKRVIYIRAQPDDYKEKLTL